MKKIIMIALLAGYSGAGCVSWPQQGRSPDHPAGMQGTPILPPGPITAEVVEPANAHRVAEAIWDEMDRDQQTEFLPAGAKEPKKR